MTYEKSKFEVKAYTMKELASFYQISVKSFRTWINPFKNEIGKKQGRYYNVNQIRVIIAKLGMPGIAEE